MKVNNQQFEICLAFLTYISERDHSLCDVRNHTKLVQDFVRGNHIKDKKISEQLKVLIKILGKFVYGNLNSSVPTFYLSRQYCVPESDVSIILNHLKNPSSDSKHHMRVYVVHDNYPKISVIISTYNRRRFLEQAIDSILMQDYPNVEIIVSDDASTDQTCTFIEQLLKKENKVIYTRNNKNIGPSLTRRNACSQHADGQFVVFLDDDDYLINSNYLSQAIEFHMLHQSASFVAANVLIENTREEYFSLYELGLEGIFNKYDYFLNLGKGGSPKPISTLTTVFKRESLIQMGIESMEMVSDASIYLRSLLVGDAGFINTIAGVYRVHGDNITFNLSREFILSNLNEKKQIKAIAIEQYGYDKKVMEEWFNQNAQNTILYYLYNSAKEPQDFECMNNWASENCPVILKFLPNT